MGLEFWVISGDDNDCFALYFGILEGVCQFCEAAAVYAFEVFGQFDAYCCLAVSEYGERFGEQLADSEGRFIDDEVWGGRVPFRGRRVGSRAFGAGSL